MLSDTQEILKVVRKNRAAAKAYRKRKSQKWQKSKRLDGGTCPKSIVGLGQEQTSSTKCLADSNIS